MADDAVALVRAYLHLNGYFTVTEYPVLEARSNETHRMATDIDVLGLRLPDAGGLVPAGGSSEPDDRFVPDPALDTPEDETDLVIAEVKEGRAKLNAGARNPDVLSAVLRRFGQCPADRLSGAVDELRNRGTAQFTTDRRGRLMAFGSSIPSGDPGFRAVQIGHVLQVLQAHLDEHWPVLRHAQIADPAVGFLSLMKKAGSGGPNPGGGRT